MVSPQPCDRAHAVEERHVQVEHRRIGGELVDELDRVQAVRRGADDRAARADRRSARAATRGSPRHRLRAGRGSCPRSPHLPTRRTSPTSAAPRQGGPGALERVCGDATSRLRHRRSPDRRDHARLDGARPVLEIVPGRRSRRRAAARSAARAGRPGASAAASPASQASRVPATRCRAALLRSPRSPRRSTRGPDADDDVALVEVEGAPAAGCAPTSLILGSGSGPRSSRCISVSKSRGSSGSYMRGSTVASWGVVAPRMTETMFPP